MPHDFISSVVFGFGAGLGWALINGLIGLVAGGRNK